VFSTCEELVFTGRGFLIAAGASSTTTGEVPTTCL
jgi:hypothetical protein